MGPNGHEATREGDLLRARLDQILNLKQELMQLAGELSPKVGDGLICQAAAVAV